MKLALGLAGLAGLAAGVWFLTRKPVEVPVPPAPAPSSSTSSSSEPPPGWFEAGGSWGIALPPPGARPVKAVEGTPAPRVTPELSIAAEWPTA